jgi:hypothetical protein
MDINSKHHNLLGIQISSKSEDFCILAATKIQKSSELGKISFQVDYDVASWYPLFGSHVMILQIISYLVIIIIIIIPLPLLLAAILSDQILGDWWSDLY